MGYTHYWTQPEDYSPDKLLIIGDAIARIIREADCDIVNGHGEEDTKPYIGEDYISFNGRGENSHESFIIEGKREPSGYSTLGWNCCKTAHKPYDKVVVAALTYLKHDWHWDVSSDGDIADWDEGIALAERALDRQFANPLIVEELVR